MKLVDKIKKTKFIEGEERLIFNNSCSVVGNSSTLLEKEYGKKIDLCNEVIRFNGAVTKGYEKKVGSKTTYRILNCHYILNMVDENYFLNQKRRYPNMKREALFEFKNENIIFKVDPSWKLWKEKKILDRVRDENNVYFIDEEFYNLGKKIMLGKEPSNGFYGLMMGLKFFNKVDCFGFNFYKEESDIHYFDKTKKTNQQKNHDFSTEEKYFKLFQKAGVINIW